jgi:RNA polymerase sigma factor (sigma-70 family)
MSRDPAADDAELAGRSAAGDDQAYAELVRRHQESLYRLLRRYAGDAEEAYEATQDAFIAAWAALGRYDRSRPFGAWLRTIAINKARDRARRRAVRRLLFSDRAVDDEAGPQHAAPEPGADAQIVEREQVLALERAVAALPTKLRGPLVLTAFDGCSHAEAGAILGVSAKTVEMRVYRARKTLAGALAEA